MSEQRIAVELRATRGSFRLEAALDVPLRGVTALFGSSGSGKTTLLRCIAGLERAEHARIEVRGELWQDTARGVFVPAHERRVGYVFQEAALFPHLSVRRNLEYGFRRVERRGERRIGFDAAVDWLGLEDLLSRSPRTLSGGERQRVAIARALLASPMLILMDEPLASLDAGAKSAILPHLERLHRELLVPIVYVSHSIEEVARLADWVLWLDSGRLAASAPAPELLARLELGVALGELAASLLDATVLRHDEKYALTLLESRWGKLWSHRLDAEPGARVRVRIQARDVSLSLEEHERSSVLNALPAVVLDAAPGAPGEMLLRLCPATGGEDVLFACVTRKSFDELELRQGLQVRARIKGISVR
jgi:molybdate transport system ATP-binding protein